MSENIKRIEVRIEVPKPKGEGWKEVSKEEFYGFMDSKHEKLEKLVNAVGKKKTTKKKASKDKLVVTNYDNFSNASFFIDQYYKAKDMLEEVDNFFKSFIMSKLVTIEDLGKHKVCKIDAGEWLRAFRKKDVFMQKIQSQDESEKYTHENSFYDDDNHFHVGKTHYFYNKDIQKKIVAESIELLQKSKYMNSSKYRTLFVIDENGVLHDFIPECLKDEIKIDFNSKAIIVSGKYYHYHEWPAQFGKSKSSMEEITVKIVIDPSNNNVIGVLRDSKEIQTGNANGKSYWDWHDRYCQPRLSGPYSYTTPDNSSPSSL
jgi:hypothetical protein